MRLSNIVLRDALDESDIERYQDVALRVLFDRAEDEEPAGLEPSAEDEVEGESPELTSEDEVDQADAPAPSPEDILRAAQDEAEALLAQAVVQAETLRQEARQQGLSQGLEEGRTQAKQDLLPALIAFAQAGQSLLVLEEQLTTCLAPELARLGLDIAEKLLGKQVAEDPQIIASVLERARAELPQARRVRVWLHPEDRELLEELRPDLVSMSEVGGRSVEVCIASDISRGGCRIETEMGIIDATLPVQLQEVGRQLFDDET